MSVAPSAHDPHAPAPVATPRHPVRFVTAASLFDGHDAAINIMRRILQATGVEVIHLGHDRSVEDVVRAAIQEDAQGIAMSSYQGGHMEYFRFMVDLLREQGADHIQVFGGGGGTIIPEEKQALEAYGVTRIYHPEDGRRLGLQGMINDMVTEADRLLGPPEGLAEATANLGPDDWSTLARLITLAEAHYAGTLDADAWAAIRASLPTAKAVPVVGITGTGGAGKSSLTDEFVLRLTEDFPELRVAVLSVDPTKRRTGGALLGDRIRMNSLACGRVFMRSLATRGSGSEVSGALSESIAICRAAGFDIIIAETSGIGQADASIVELVDIPVYVMTPEFGAPSQLEKIEMIDLADLVIVNKFDRAGAEDALRDVKKAFQRAHQRFTEPVDSMPVHGTMASQWGDRGVNGAYRALLARVASVSGRAWEGLHTAGLEVGVPDRSPIIPPARVRYLSDVASRVRAHRGEIAAQAELSTELWALGRAIAHLGGPPIAESPKLYEAQVISEASGSVSDLMAAANTLYDRLSSETKARLQEWPALVADYAAETTTYQVRGRDISVENRTQSLSGQSIPKVVLPRLSEWGAIVRFCGLENRPGAFPFTAGVFPFKRRGEDPTRMFAGEGGPWQTNKRFHYLSKHGAATRLSTAFDSVTLYGQDPARRPDIWGKVGNAGVSIATVEDMEALYAGFDLIAPATSVSMTINGPAPTLLAFYFQAATRQTLRRHLRDAGKITVSDADCLQPNGGGYSFDALRQLVTDEEWLGLRAATVAKLRGTVQADILKEDQAQNTCIFSTAFSLKVQGDMQAWFIENAVRNFYSVSISGYHIAEAGANPITQLAFTLANGFTFVEYFRARGMDINAFAPSLSFFFSNGMDPEYAVIGRVARRIWAVAMRDIYGADARSQKLKYHIQTSGRSLHAQEIDFNDIRTTLQALLALQDNCNSLHTNAYDEAITTPTEESVRRALAIQLIINHEFGVMKGENPTQGAYFIDVLTDLVEDAVLAEFDRLTDRGGVLGAMERMYQRSRIQEESMHYEGLKHSGALPVIGVNTFLAPERADGPQATTLELIRSSDADKQAQLDRLVDFQGRHADRAPAAIDNLKTVAREGGNVFAELLDAVEVLSLGQVSGALFEVGGRYRRNM